MQKTERINLQQQVEKLQAQYRELMRGRMVPSARTQIIRRKIAGLQDKIKRLDADAAERLALEKAPIDDVLEVIAIPLLADVMNDVVAGVDAMLRRQGAQETVFGMYTAQIRKAAMARSIPLTMRKATCPVCWMWMTRWSMRSRRN